MLCINQNLHFSNLTKSSWHGLLAAAFGLGGDPKMCIEDDPVVQKSDSIVEQQERSCWTCRYLSWLLFSAVILWHRRRSKKMCRKCYVGYLSQEFVAGNRKAGHAEYYVSLFWGHQLSSHFQATLLVWIMVTRTCFLV